MFDLASRQPNPPADAGRWATVAAGLEQLPITASGPEAVLAGLEQVRALLAWAGGVQTRLLARAQTHQEELDQDGKEWLGEEVGAVLRVDGGWARTRMMYATELVDRLPATLARLDAGQVSPAQAQLVAEVVFGLPDDAATAVEARVLPRASDQSLGQLRVALRRAVNAAAPKIAEQRHTDAITQRTVRIRASDDGMSTLWALLPTPDAIRVHAVLTHHANTHHQIEQTDATIHDDHNRALRTIDQLRADALIALAERYLASPNHYLDELADLCPTPNSIRIKPTIQVTIALSTLIGDDDQPAELTGHGPIPASLARLIATDRNATWRRIITDPAGHPIDYGTTRYKPPTNLNEFIRARHMTCAYPTCNRAATICEIDHVKPRSERGPTNADNLLPLCARHHHLKHEAGWTIRHNPATATTTWTTPHGRTYTNYADPLPTGDP